MKVRILLGRNQLFDGNHWILTLMKTLLIKPKEIGGLIKLEGLGLANNQLAQEIPEEIANLTNLIGLNLSSNQLCPPYPDCIKYTVGVQDISGCG